MSPASIDDRIVSAEVRVTNACRVNKRSAERLLEELDQVTDIGWRPEIHEETSTVEALEQSLAANQRVAATR